MVKFRKGKDKEGKVYTYPIDTERKTKKSKPATKQSKPKQSKPKKSKPKKSAGVKYAEKYINIIEDITPLGDINKHTTYISDKSAYEQSEEAVDMIKIALKGSKIARNKRPAKKPKLSDEEINELYMEFNA